MCRASINNQFYDINYAFVFYNKNKSNIIHLSTPHFYKINLILSWKYTQVS